MHSAGEARHGWQRGSSPIDIENQVSRNLILAVEGQWEEPAALSRSHGAGESATEREVTSCG